MPPPSHFNFNSCHFGTFAPVHEGDTNNTSNTAYYQYNSQQGVGGGDETGEENEREDTGRAKKRNEAIPAGKKQGKTILEQILIAMTPGAISELFEEGRDFEAYGILQSLHKMGPTVCRFPLQVDYYEVLMKIGKGEEADKLMDDMLKLLKGKLKVTNKDCTRLAKKYFDSKNYYKSILFDLIGSYLLPDLKDCDQMLGGIARNMTRLQRSVEKLSKRSFHDKKTIRLWILPRMRHTLQLVFSKIKGKSKKALTVAEVACKHKLEISELYVDDTDAREITLTEGIEQLKSVLGQEAKEMHLLGTYLNNLGANCLVQKRPQEAKDFITEAIEIQMNAKDYDTQEEREGDILRSSRALSQAEDALRYQN